MRNPELTKNQILESSSILFNTKGYKATSISDITEETGFTKGAIYKHFTNKEHLEIETFEYMVALISSKLKACIVYEKTAGAKLRALLNFFATYVNKPIIKGGCPLLNTAIEFDESKLPIKKLARKTLVDYKQTIIHILKKGKQYDQIQQGLDEEKFASFFFASIEGGIMVSKLSGKQGDMVAVIDYLEEAICNIEIS